MHRYLDIQLNIEAGAPDRFASLLRDWFAGGFAVLGSTTRERLLAGGPLDGTVLRTGKRFGRPGSPWMTLVIVRTGPDGRPHEESVAYSEDHYRQFVQALGPTTDAALTWLCTIGDDGYPGHGLRLQMSRNDADPRWFYLQAAVLEECLDDPDYQHRLLDVVRSAAHRCDPGFGHITHTYYPNLTALEAQVPGVDADEAMRHSRRELRGYSWLTICPQELGDRLGGVDALAASGAFHEVQPLEQGGYWLLATADYRDYDLAAATRVFHALAPVIRPGRPFDPADSPTDPKPYLIVVEDAARYRT